MEKHPEEKINNDISGTQDTSPGGRAAGDEASENLLNKQYQDALAEVGNISLGAAATALSQLVNRVVQITTPKIILTTMKDIRTSYPIPCLVVTVNYLRGLEGNNILIVRKDDALKIVGLMMGMEPPEKPEDLGEMELSAISEAMNQMMGSAATSMSDLFNRTVEISPPEVSYRDLEKESVDREFADENSFIIQIAFRLVVEGSLDSELLQLIPLEYGEKMASSLLAAFFPEMSAEPPPESSGAELLPEQEPPADAPDEAPPADEMESAIRHNNVTGVAPGISIEKNYGLSQGDYEKINLIKDIPIEINAVLGRAKLPLKKIFSLSPGEIITLENYLGEPVELYANNQLVARGEVVLVNGQFGVRITAMVRSGFTSIRG